MVLSHEVWPVLMWRYYIDSHIANNTSRDASVEGLVVGYFFTKKELGFKSSKEFDEIFRASLVKNKWDKEIIEEVMSEIENRKNN